MYQGLIKKNGYMCEGFAGIVVVEIVLICKRKVKNDLPQKRTPFSFTKDN